MDPAYSEGFPGCRVGRNHRAVAAEARWHQCLAQLVDFRQEGSDWPRRYDYDSGTNTLSECRHAAV